MFGFAATGLDIVKGREEVSVLIDAVLVRRKVAQDMLENRAHQRRKDDSDKH